MDELWKKRADDGKAEPPRAGWSDRGVAGYLVGTDGYLVAADGTEIRGLAFVHQFATGDGEILKLDPCIAKDVDAERALVDWLIREGKTRGVVAVNVWTVDGAAMGLGQLGFGQVREYWRMDRLDLRNLARVVTKEPVTVVDGADPTARMSDWVAAYNEAFSDEWQHWPETEQSFAGWVKAEPRLALAAVDHKGIVVGVALGRIQWFSGDSRRQPVGHILVVGVIPAQRGNRIGPLLLTELLRRFDFEDALSASIRTDTGSQYESRRTYAKLGFTWALSLYIYEQLIS
jgi:ribosomal protein S18 acetylase RimI-like enzyme